MCIYRMIDTVTCLEDAFDDMSHLMYADAVYLLHSRWQVESDVDCKFVMV